MAVFDLVSFTALLLEHRYFITFRLAKNLSLDRHPFEGRRSYLHFSVIIGKEHLIEGDLITFFSIEPIDDDPLVLADLVLMPGYLYNGVHEH